MVEDFWIQSKKPIKGKWKKKSENPNSSRKEENGVKLEWGSEERNNSEKD